MSLQVVVTDRNSVVVSAPGPQGPQGAAGSGSGSGTVTSTTAGTGLSGGTITTSGTLAVSYGTTAGTACEGNDSRLSDARTPTSHSHVAADIGSVLGPGLVGRSAASTGTCERIGLGSGLTIDGSKNLALSTTPAAQTIQMIAGTGLTGGGDLSANRSFAVSFGTTASTACVGNDSRLSDSRAPTEHTHYAPQSYVGHIETPTARTYYIDLYAPALSITSLRFKTSSGTVDVTLYNGASQVYTADGLGTTRTDVTTGLSNTAVSAGGTISLVVDAVSTPADLQFVIAYTTSSGGVE